MNRHKSCIEIYKDLSISIFLWSLNRHKSCIEIIGIIRSIRINISIEPTQELYWNVVCCFILECVARIEPTQELYWNLWVTIVFILNPLIEPTQELYWNREGKIFRASCVAIEPTQELYWNIDILNGMQKKIKLNRHKSCIEIEMGLNFWFSDVWLNRHKSCIEIYMFPNSTN